MPTDPHIFQPIDHDSVADAVVTQIEDLIVSRVLRQGARLPDRKSVV